MGKSVATDSLSIFHCLLLMMNLEFDRAEAFMALGLITIAADGEILAAETGCLQEIFEMLAPISAEDKAEFDNKYLEIFESTFEKLYSAFPNENLILNEPELDRLILAILAVISEAERGQLLELAMRVALADGLDMREEKIIDRLQQHLEISPEVVRQIRENCEYPIC